MSLWLPVRKGYGFTVQDPAGGDHSALLIYGSEEYINVAGTAEVCNNEVDDDGDGLGDFDDEDCPIPSEWNDCDCSR